MAEVLLINPEQIIFAEPEFLGREAEKIDDPEFKEFAADVDERGLDNLFSVRPVEDGKFAVIDGNRRALAIKTNWANANSKTRARYANGLPCQVFEISDIEGLGRQIGANHQSKKQKPASLAKSCYKYMLATNKTIPEVAKHVGMSPYYLESIMKINVLPENVRASIDAGEISATNSIHLTKLPQEFLDEDFVDKAKLMSGPEFGSAVDTAVKNYKKALREGKDPTKVDGEVVFCAKPKQRMKEELESMYNIALQRAIEEPSEFNRGYAEAFKYSFRMDEQTLEGDKLAFEQSVKEAAEKKEKRKTEREQKRAASMLDFIKNSNNPEVIAQLKAIVS